MKVKSLKKALTYDEQEKQLIEDKGLCVDNRKNVLEVLKRENYYRLSGYWSSNINENGRFNSAMTFEEIYENYKFDKFLRGILIEVINDVEVYFKTRLTNYHALKYGAGGYLKKENFNIISQQKHKGFIMKIDRLKRNNANNPMIYHHKVKYDGTLPLWAAVELLSFGTISKMYSMMENIDKNHFTKGSYKNISYIYIEGFYHAITYLRNQCCHFQRLYDVKHTIRTKNFRTSFYDSQGDNCSTFYFLYILLLLNPNHDLGETFISKLLDKFEKTEIDKSKYGFPTDWKYVLINANGHCIAV